MKNEKNLLFFLFILGTFALLPLTANLNAKTTQISASLNVLQERLIHLAHEVTTIKTEQPSKPQKTAPLEPLDIPKTTKKLPDLAPLPDIDPEILNIKKTGSETPEHIDKPVSISEKLEPITKQLKLIYETSYKNEEYDSTFEEINTLNLSEIDISEYYKIHKFVQELNEEFYTDIKENLQALETKKAFELSRPFLDDALSNFKKRKRNEFLILIKKTFDTFKGNTTEEQNSLNFFIEQVENNSNYDSLEDNFRKILKRNFSKFFKLSAAKKVFFDGNYTDAKDKKVLILQKKVSTKKPVEKERTIIRLTSLVQKEPLDCGYYALYNTIQFKKKIDDKTIDELNEKDQIGQENDYAPWHIKQKQFLAEYFKKEAQELIKERTESANKKLLSRNIDVKDKTQTIEEKITAYIQQSTTFLVGGSLEKLIAQSSVPSLFLLQSHNEELDLLEALLCTPLNKLVEYGYADFFDKIKDYRNNGSPFFLIVNSHSHYLTIVFTQRGMFICDSLNRVLENNQSDKELAQTLYDVVLIGKLPK